MQNALIDRGKSNVVVVESTSSIRMMIMDILRSLGFAGVQGVGTGKEVVGLMEVEDIQWIIMPLSAQDSINGMHMLKLINTEPLLRRTLVTFMIDPLTDSYVIPLAFEQGLFSYMEKSYVKDFIQNEFEDLIMKHSNHNGNATLTAADYLRQFLTPLGLCSSLLSLERNLLSAFPGSAKILLHLAEAELLAGNIAKALNLFAQIEMLDEKLAPICKIYRSKHANQDDISVGSIYENVLSLKNVVIVDPDSDVLFAISEILARLGVKSVNTFENGQDAFEWLRISEKEPDLIVMEWRLPGLSGPSLVQRIRQIGHVQVPIIIASSLIKRDEKPLLLEMGVDEVLEKPFDRASFLKVAIWAVQQNKQPTDIKSQHRRFRRFLEADKRVDAERLMSQILADEKSPESSRMTVKAEFAFASEDYQSACERAVEALRIGGEGLPLLNLLGKAFLKMNQLEKALKCFERSNTLCAMNLERLLSIAEINLRLHQPIEANAALDRANDIDPENLLLIEARVKIRLETGPLNTMGGDLDRIESVAKIASYINNRAIALARTGRSDDSIALYNQAIVCLSGKWPELSAAVTYNLGLAYARNTDYAKAILALSHLKGNYQPDFHKKIKSLLRKLNEAVESGVKIFLEKSPNTQREVRAEHSGISTSSKVLTAGYWDNLFSKIELQRCDLACYLLFSSIDEHDPKAIELLQNIPRFHSRRTKPAAPNLVK